MVSVTERGRARLAMDAIPVGAPEDVVILIPVYNDWPSLTSLLGSLDLAIGPWPARILVVNDGSTDPPPEVGSILWSRLVRVDVLELHGNMGHQRAIAIGLAFIQTHLEFRAVVVMDGDGEDRPEDVPRLLDEMAKGGDASAVFAQRTKRSEGLVFRAGYQAYKAIHRPLTGLRVQVGNFSALPRCLISRLVVSSDLWSHYAAAAVRSRAPITLLETSRAPRISGRSKMNAVSLMLHGLSAMAVFGDRIAARLLAGAVALALIAACAVPLASSGVVPGVDLAWDWRMTVVAIGALTQLLATLLVFVFLLLYSRIHAGFIPIRDYETYLQGCWEL